MVAVAGRICGNTANNPHYVHHNDNSNLISTVTASAQFVDSSPIDCSQVNNLFSTNGGKAHIQDFNSGCQALISGGQKAGFSVGPKSRQSGHGQ
jgi:hypothetical protein